MQLRRLHDVLVLMELPSGKIGDKMRNYVGPSSTCEKQSGARWKRFKNLKRLEQET